MAKRQCAYCVYLDPTKINEGKYKCEKDRNWHFANSEEAENCYRYCERFRKDMYLGDQCIRMSAAWQEKHKPTTYSGCYITTAVVEILGLPDDTYELEVLREFRKNYLQKNEEYHSLLFEYDVKGPVIAEALRISPDREKIALDLYNIYIKGTVAYIKLEDYASAIDLYVEMTNNLAKKYLQSFAVGDKIKENYDIDNGGHGKLSLKKN